jgi:hypothetical protein
MTSLFIKHALYYCTTHMVTETLNSIFPKSVISVEETIHINKYGFKSKSFRIHVARSQCIQNILLNRIQMQGFAAIVYDNTWDSKLQRSVDRYWKIYLSFVPRLMSEEEQMNMMFNNTIENSTLENSDTDDDMPPLEPYKENVWVKEHPQENIYETRQSRSEYNLTEKFMTEDLEFLD